MVTPDPEMPYSMWHCNSCGAYDQHGPGFGPRRRDHIDEGASQHVQEYGHMVTIQHGQSKELHPLACEPPRRMRHHPDGDTPLSEHERAEWERLMRRMT